MGKRKAELATPEGDVVGEVRTASKLPKRLRKIIKRQFADGVTYSVNWHGARSSGERLKITAIHWRPGKRNALAAAVIAKVHGPMPLELDGHHYTITPAEAPSGTQE